MDCKYQKAIESEPEFFAQIIENREAIPLLAPFAAGHYDVAIELRTCVDFTKYYWCTIKRVFPPNRRIGWEAVGSAGSIIEAVRKAVAEAKPMVEEHGL